MLERIRRLNISLAAKCQLLFGGAVVMIIAAALFVPWRRMEQLTEQLNDTAASAVADSALRHHVATAVEPTTGPATQPIQSPSNLEHPLVRVNGRDSFPPRIIGISPEPSAVLTGWERWVLAQLQKQPEQRYSRKYKRWDGTEAFHYAEALQLQHE